MRGHTLVSTTPGDEGALLFRVAIGG